MPLRPPGRVDGTHFFWLRGWLRLSVNGAWLLFHYFHGHALCSTHFEASYSEEVLPGTAARQAAQTTVAVRSASVAVNTLSAVAELPHASDSSPYDNHATWSYMGLQ